MSFFRFWKQAIFLTSFHGQWLILVTKTINKSLPVHIFTPLEGSINTILSHPGGLMAANLNPTENTKDFTTFHKANLELFPL